MKKQKSYTLTSTILLFLLFRVGVNAQVNTFLRQPLPWHVTLDQLWNASIINSENKIIQVNFKIRLVNSTGNLLLEGAVNQYQLQKGNNVIFGNQLNPFYTFSTYANNNIRSGVLPYGKYTYCMHIYDLNGQEISLGCIEDYEVSAISPPQLFIPSHESIINTHLPFLSWTPPSPPISGLDISYDIKLVEILPGQTLYDAIKRNFARMELKGHSTCYLQYPTSALPIEENKVYAWQVIAKNNDYMIGETEIWSFIYQKLNIPEINKQGVYTKVKKYRDGSFTGLINGKLYFQFDEMYSESATLKFNIYNAEHINVTKKCNQKLLKSSGDNRFEIDISRCSSFKKGVYYLEVVNAKNESYYLTFKVE